MPLKLEISAGLISHVAHMQTLYLSCKSASYALIFSDKFSLYNRNWFIFSLQKEGDDYIQTKPKIVRPRYFFQGKDDNLIVSCRPSHWEKAFISVYVVCVH